MNTNEDITIIIYCKSLEKSQENLYDGPQSFVEALKIEIELPHGGFFSLVLQDYSFLNFENFLRDIFVIPFLATLEASNS